MPDEPTKVPVPAVTSTGDFYGKPLESLKRLNATAVAPIAERVSTLEKKSVSPSYDDSAVQAALTQNASAITAQEERIQSLESRPDTTTPPITITDPGDGTITIS